MVPLSVDQLLSIFFKGVLVNIERLINGFRIYDMLERPEAAAECWLELSIALYIRYKYEKSSCETCIWPIP